MITHIQIKLNLARVCVNGLDVLFSYDTPVAIALPDGRRYKTDCKFSRVTTRHIKEAGFADAVYIPHGFLLRHINQYTT